MPRRDLRRLERRLTDVAERLERGVNGLVRGVIEEIGEGLVPATPVRTGRARANWRPSLGVPATQPVTLLDPTGAATVARIARVGQGWNIGDVFYLVNRVSYITRLNAGSSPQARAGFVQREVREGVRRGVQRVQVAGGLL